MTDKKHIIWQNYRLNLDDWMEELRDNEKINGFNPDEHDDVYYYEEMVDLNLMYLDEDRCNLAVYLDHDIIAIADIGRWNGRHSGYRIYEGVNIGELLYSECDYCEWYVDEHGDMRFRGSHHDGNNSFLYRALRDGITDNQLDKLCDALLEDKPEAPDLIKKYTYRIGDYVGDIFGWKFPNRPTKGVTKKAVRLHKSAA